MKKVVETNKVRVAIGPSQHPILIGNFRSTLKNGELNIYYNIDLGQNKKKIFDCIGRKHEDLSKIHHSLHASGQSHLKLKKSREKLQKGFLSDGSKLINAEVEENLTIFGLESFFIDRAPLAGDPANDLIILDPPNSCSCYSILWLFVHSSYPKNLSNRMFWVNLWRQEKDVYSVQTASLSDILFTHETFTVLTANNWSIRACFLKTLLPILDTNNNSISLIHPKGQELPWRAFTFVDAHLPLSNIIKAKAATKPIILTTKKSLESKASINPTAWIKLNL